MLKGKQNKINRLFKRHNESRHLWFCQRNRIPLTNLVNPERNHTATAAHHVTITCAANLSLSTLAALRHSNLLLNGLGDTHRIDRICRLVGGEAYHALHACINSGIQGVVRTNHIRLHSFHREELARGHLLQGCCMEHIVHALHRILQRALVAHVTDVELNLVRHFRHPRLEVVTHIVLLLLVAAEDTYLTDVSPQKAIENCITKAARTTGNEQRFSFKNTHNVCYTLICYIFLNY